MKQVEQGKTDQYKEVFRVTIDNEEAGIGENDVKTLEQYEKLLY